MHRPGSPGYLAEQRADLLRFMVGARHPLGFGWLDEAGRLDGSHPVELWITCRMTHVAALGLLLVVADLSRALRDEERQAWQRLLRVLGLELNNSLAPIKSVAGTLADLVAHGVAALTGALHDEEHGGWFAAVGPEGPVDDRKQAYGHAFVVLAASSAAAAGAVGAQELLDEALATSLARFWDESAGLSVEEWDRAWTTLDTYRGVNANMHTVEAYLAAGDVTGDASWHARAGRIAAQVVAWASANDWRIPEHFDARWTPVLEHHHDQPAIR